MKKRSPPKLEVRALPAKAEAPQIVLRPSGTHRCLAGHPWIYESEIGKVEGEPSESQVVAVRDSQRRMVGWGLFSGQSQIRVRLLSRERTELDRNLLLQRIRAASARREPAECQRLVWSEADGLPGLVIDRYGSIAVVQILHAAIEARRAVIFDAVEAELKPGTILDRSDNPIRKFEGLPLRAECVRGDYVPPTRHRIGDAHFDIDLLTGHKTGGYLDQAANYRKIASFARGRRVLDCFANAGGFAIHCAMAGATTVDAVESSATAVAEGQRNAEINRTSVTWHEANAFDWLRQAARERRQFDLIILDPPSFTKSRDRADAALAGYREISVRAFQMLAPGGILATYCCSHHVALDTFEEVTRGACGDTHRTARLLERHAASADHPILLAMPESEYLKGLVVQVE